MVVNNRWEGKIRKSGIQLDALVLAVCLRSERLNHNKYRYKYQWRT